MQFVPAEIEAGKIAGIGLVAEAAIDRISACIDGFTKGGWRSRRTDQFHHWISLSDRLRISTASLVNDGGGRSSDPCEITRKIDIAVIEGVSHRKQGFHVPDHLQVAGKEQRIGIATPLKERSSITSGASTPASAVNASLWRTTLRRRR